MIDCLWDLRPGTLRAWFKRLRLRLATRAVHRFVVWAGHEVEDYATAFGLPREKLAYVPFHTTVNDYEYEVRDDGYLFAGGNSGRDLSAVDRGGAAARPCRCGSPARGPACSAAWRAALAARSRVHLDDAGRLPARRWRRRPAGRDRRCGERVASTRRRPADLPQRHVSWASRPIAVGRNEPADFIEDDVTGPDRRLRHHDPAGLRRAIAWIMENPEAAARGGRRARDHAATFTTERTMRAVRLGRVGQPHSPPRIDHRRGLAQCPRSRSSRLNGGRADRQRCPVDDERPRARRRPLASRRHPHPCSTTTRTPWPTATASRSSARRTRRSTPSRPGSRTCRVVSSSVPRSVATAAK